MVKYNPKQWKEIDVYKFNINTIYGEMIADSRTKDIKILKKELKQNYGYGNKQIKSIKFRNIVKGMVKI